MRRNKKERALALEDTRDLLPPFDAQDADLDTLARSVTARVLLAEQATEYGKELLARVRVLENMRYVVCRTSKPDASVVKAFASRIARVFYSEELVGIDVAAKRLVYQERTYKPMGASLVEQVRVALTPYHD